MPLHTRAVRRGFRISARSASHDAASGTPVLVERRCGRGPRVRAHRSVRRSEAADCSRLRSRCQRMQRERSTARAGSIVPVLWLPGIAFPPVSRCCFPVVRCSQQSGYRAAAGPAPHAWRVRLRSVLSERLFTAAKQRIDIGYKAAVTRFLQAREQKPPAPIGDFGHGGRFRPFRISEHATRHLHFTLVVVQCVQHHNRGRWSELPRSFYEA